jgi:MFS transporter, putative metabolite:H+ symporter
MLNDAGPIIRLTRGELVARMERLPFAKIHKRIFLLTAAGYLFDAYDIALLSFIMPALSADLHLSAGQIGIVFSITFAGMFVGTLLSGAAADYFGRLKIFKYTLLLFSVATALTAFVKDYETLLILRFITGLGLGGEQPVSFTYVSEMMPSKYRGRIAGIVEAMWGFGAMLAGGVALALVPNFGWQSAFLAGMLPAVLIWFFRLGIPESPRWFMIKNRPEEAEDQLLRIESEVERQLGRPLPAAETAAQPQPVEQKAGFKALFGSAFRRRTAMLCLVWFFAMFGFWGVNTWIPTLLKQSGYSLYASIGVFFLMNTMGVPGCLLGAYLADKVGRKLPMISYWTLAAGTTVIYGWALTEQLPIGIMLGCGIAAILFMLGGFAVLYAYTPESYPTEIRATGTGLANSLGRVGAMVSPALVGTLYPVVGLFPTICTISAGFFVAAMSIALLGDETRGKTLEDIATGRSNQRSSPKSAKFSYDR